MAERGPTQAATREAASARLGGTIRSILVTPDAGYRGVFALADAREEVGLRPSEGAATYVLGAAGGAQLMLLWLEVGGLLGLRGVSEEDFQWIYLAVAIVAAALVTVIAQWAWGPIGRAVLSSGETPVSASRLRIVWGAAALPQVVALVVLLPLDLVIVGRDLFTSERIGSTFSAAWSALSVAVALSLAAWSVFLFFKGIQVASGASPWRSAAALGVALGCLVLVAGGFLIGAVLLSSSPS